MAKRQKTSLSIVIFIELVIYESKIRCLKLLQKELNESKICQVLPIKFSPLVIKIAKCKQFSRVEIIETS